MTETRPRFWYDYVDPLSYLVERDLSALEAVGWEAVACQPLELRAPPAELVHPKDPLWVRRWEDAERLAEPRGLSLRQPSLVPWTRKAHELALHARELGCFAQVHTALFEAFLLEGEDIGRVDVLVALAVEAGLDASEAKAVLDVDRYTAALDGLRGEAERLGVRGVPTLLVGGERIEGVLPVEALRVLLDKA